MVIAAALRAFPILFHAATRRLLLKSLAWTLLIFLALGGALWGVFHLVRLHFDWGGGGLAEAAATALAMVPLGWLLFRAVAMAVMGFYADEIVMAVERDSYPQAAREARPMGPARSLRFALASLGRTLGWNIAALPAYLVLIITGVGSIGLFLALNAYLLGRDLADMVQPRHPSLPPIPRGSRWLMGLVSALLLIPPFVNLLAPVWSAAMAVHMLHGVRRKSA
ncbi:EI24 domain-containing protein [Sphingobium cloacae]|uniref:Cysteine biosynthesis protein n=1 Tax=Sphingobium cloacae TaxID=120107 RepID=A0A1E1F3Y9_9SPHN|nr:EI24 domain-containing protein [Sphingobium cloacae]BAV65151.1 hypothetical protein SCLO_1021110 [Sphingobium cloacae]